MSSKDCRSGSAILPPRALNQLALDAGTRHLAEADPHLGRIVARLGVPPMFGRRPGYGSLVRIILEQQVSLAAARAMFRRIDRHVGGIAPETIASLGTEGLRALGLTRQKARYCHGLAERILEGRLDLSAVTRADEQEGRAALLEVPGIGPWTVDIYFLMALRRPDVWPRGDLALAVAMREARGMRRLPDHRQQQTIAARWSPWRSVAARILWTHYLARV